MTRNPLEAPPTDPVAVVVHTPTGRDGALVAELLSSHGHLVRRTVTTLDLARQMDESVGTVVLAEEALQEEASRLLLDHLAAQPSWSDLPVIILTAPTRGPRAPNGRLTEFLDRSNVTLLERPGK